MGTEKHRGTRLRGELGVERHRLDGLLVLEQPPVSKLQGVRDNGEAVSHLGVQPCILGYLHRQVSQIWEEGMGEGWGRPLEARVASV